MLACVREKVCEGVIPVSHTITPRLIALCFVALHRHCVFHKIEGRTLHSKKIMTRLFAVVCNRIYSISEVCL